MLLNSPPVSGAVLSGLKAAEPGLTCVAPTLVKKEQFAENNAALQVTHNAADREERTNDLKEVRPRFVYRWGTNRACRYQLHQSPWTRR
jgi:hypothetical protein